MHNGRGVPVLSSPNNRNLIRTASIKDHFVILDFIARPLRLRALWTLLAAAGLMSLTACGGGDADTEAAAEGVDAGEARRHALATTATTTVPGYLTRFQSGETLQPGPDDQGERLIGVVPPPPEVDAATGIVVYRDPGVLTTQYEGGDENDRFARVVSEAARPSNLVMHVAARTANVVDTEGTPTKARVQVNAYNTTAMRARELGVTVRLFLFDDVDLLRSMPEAFNWLTISEWWNNAGWTGQPYPFRISVNIVKPSPTVDTQHSPLYFSAKAQSLHKASNTWNTPLWERVNTQYRVPIGRWLTIDYFYREGKATSGRFRMAVTPDGGTRTIVFDVTGWTQHPSDPAPDGLTHLNPMKLYTSKAVVDHVRNSGGMLQMYWDDPTFRICRGLTPTGFQSPCVPLGLR